MPPLPQGLQERSAPGQVRLALPPLQELPGPQVPLRPLLLAGLAGLAGLARLRQSLPVRAQSSCGGRALVRLVAHTTLRLPWVRSAPVLRCRYPEGSPAWPQRVRPGVVRLGHRARRVHPGRGHSGRVSGAWFRLLPVWARGGARCQTGPGRAGHSAERCRQNRPPAVRGCARQARGERAHSPRCVARARGGRCRCLRCGHCGHCARAVVRVRCVLPVRWRRTATWTYHAVGRCCLADRRCWVVPRGRVAHGLGHRGFRGCPGVRHRAVRGFHALRVRGPPGGLQCCAQGGDPGCRHWHWDWDWDCRRVVQRRGCRHGYRPGRCCASGHGLRCCGHRVRRGVVHAAARRQELAPVRAQRPVSVQHQSRAGPSAKQRSLALAAQPVPVGAWGAVRRWVVPAVRVARRRCAAGALGLRRAVRPAARVRRAARL